MGVDMFSGRGHISRDAVQSFRYFEPSSLHPFISRDITLYILFITIHNNTIRGNSGEITLKSAAFFHQGDDVSHGGTGGDGDEEKEKERKRRGENKKE